MVLSNLLYFAKGPFQACQKNFQGSWLGKATSWAKFTYTTLAWHWSHLLV